MIGRDSLPCLLQWQRGGAGKSSVCDDFSNDIRVFNPEGSLLQVIGRGGDSKVQWQGNLQGVCTDAEGRFFIVDGQSVVVLSSA
jgi:hypothetical protein